ncbi:hypothetical protein [Rhizobium sp. YK2]|uniref:hypothetical protein n=1 Tax=Rhizobium sp. YK2 TaxID=1860096 RepID=UPI001FD8BD67|nr:hypothetical protein [Rhizobium sp. YK2]
MKGDVLLNCRGRRKILHGHCKCMNVLLLFGRRISSSHGCGAGLNKLPQLRDFTSKHGVRFAIFKFPADDVSIQPVPFFLHGDAGPIAARGPDQSFACQDFDGFPQGVSSDTEARGEFRFQRQLLSGLPIAFHDGSAEPFDGVHDYALRKHGLLLLANILDPIYNSFDAWGGQAIIGKCRR